jgi:lauroyl/myristoyl acyltransferase
MTALVEVTDNAMFDLYTKHRESTGMRTYPVTRAGYAFLDIIRNNRVLAVLADRDIMKNGISVRFFSGKRNIVFAYMVLNPSSKRVRYLGVIEPPIIFDGDADAFNRLMVSKFEKFIRKYPDQWFVFHPEWIEQGANA